MDFWLGLAIFALGFVCGVYRIVIWEWAKGLAGK